MGEIKNENYTQPVLKNIMSTIDTKENMDEVKGEELEIKTPVAGNILDEVYPDWRSEAPLPSDLLSLCMEYLIAEKVYYHKSGTLGSRGFMVNGKMYGVWKQWSDPLKFKLKDKPRLEFQCTYNAYGKYHGKFQKWKDDKTLWICVSYVNGELHGLSQEWDSDGDLDRDELYVHGKKHGECKVWYRGTKRMFEHVFYIHGTAEGPYKYWNYNGSLREQGVYIKGEKSEVYTPEQPEPTPKLAESVTTKPTPFEVDFEGYF